MKQKTHLKSIKKMVDYRYINACLSFHLDSVMRHRTSLLKGHGPTRRSRERVMSILGCQNPLLVGNHRPKPQVSNWDTHQQVRCYFFLCQAPVAHSEQFICFSSPNQVAGMDLAHESKMKQAEKANSHGLESRAWAL